MNSHSSPQGWRDYLHAHPMLVTVAAGFVMIVAAVLAFGPDRPPAGAPRGTWYVDLSTGERFAGASGMITPFAARDGAQEKTAVRAVVFTCSSCGEAGDQFVGWLEMHNPRVIERAQSHGGDTSHGMLMLQLNESPDGILVHPPQADVSAADDPGQWFARQSPTASRIMREAQSKCSGEQRAARCEPQA